MGLRQVKLFYIQGSELWSGEGLLQSPQKPKRTPHHRMVRLMDYEGRLRVKGGAVLW
jgi:hypothetical protein